MEIAQYVKQVEREEAVLAEYWRGLSRALPNPRPVQTTMALPSATLLLEVPFSSFHSTEEKTEPREVMTLSQGGRGEHGPLVDLSEPHSGLSTLSPTVL